MIRIAVADDDENDLRKIIDILNGFIANGNEKILADAFSDSGEFMRTYSDIYQLLVLCPDENGAEMLRFIDELRRRGSNCEIVLVSKATDYALVGYNYAIARYFKKPISASSLLAAVREALERVRVKFNWRMFDNSWFGVYIGTNGFAAIHTEYLAYCRHDGENSIFYTDYGTVTAKREFGAVEKILLSSGFVSIDDNTLVNPVYIVSFDSDTVELFGGAEFAVADKNRAPLQKLLCARGVACLRAE